MIVGEDAESSYKRLNFIKEIMAGVWCLSGLGKYAVQLFTHGRCLARPSPEALAVDVFGTVRSLGFPIEVLSDYDQTMNRYAFLLVE